jgi:hypothetical protein
LGIRQQPHGSRSSPSQNSAQIASFVSGLSQSSAVQILPRNVSSFGARRSGSLSVTGGAIGLPALAMIISSPFAGVLDEARKTGHGVMDVDRTHGPNLV